MEKNPINSSSKFSGSKNLNLVPPSHFESRQISSDPITPSSYQFLDRMSLPKSNSASEKSDPLQRLEVETTSTTSVPISFPYYYIDEANQSFDTFNLLHAGSDTQEQPVYKNTTHNISQSPKPTKDSNKAIIGGIQVEKGSASPESISRLQEISNDAFNPVPKRFSQFITEQQQYNPKPLDDLTSNTTSIGTDSEASAMARRKKKSSSSMQRGKHSPTLSYGMRSSGHSLFDNKLIKEVSNSAESQATIFSTRADEQTKSNQELNRTNTDTSSLRRRKAIRSKEGGFFYRLKLRMKKFLRKLKLNKFKRTASSKRTGSIRVKSKTLKRKQRSKPKNKNVSRLLTISAPLNNPELGVRGATKVSTLDNALKYEAGAQLPPGQFATPATNNATLKMNHLSQYIDQQQGLYLTNMDKKANSINYGRSPSIKITDQNLYDQIKEIPVSESSSIPPPVPKHGNNQTVLGSYEDLVDLWRNYLIFVVLKRIQLRQEISYFQKLLVGQEVRATKPSIGSKFSMYSIQEQNYEYDNEELTSETSDSESGSEIEADIDSDTISEASDIETIPDGTLIDDDVKVFAYTDATTEKFNRKYNRQSVLGEMLDYNSDGTELVSSSQISSVPDPIDISKQYGTKLSRSLSSMSSTNKSPMRRSAGYQMGLNMAR